MSAVRAACFALAAFLLTGPTLAAPAMRPRPRIARRRARSPSAGSSSSRTRTTPTPSKSFEKAESKIHAPPHWLYIARSQAKLDKLVAARETYGQILAEKLPDSAPPPFREAQASAKTELAELEARIPRSSSRSPARARRRPR